MSFTLVFLVSIGMLGKYESNTTGSVPGFVSRENCQAAGAIVSAEFGKGTKEVRFVCVATK